jgi:hypothetical protein
MKHSADHYTRDLLGNPRGRPRKVNAKTGAQRQREYLKRKLKAQGTEQQFPSHSDGKSFCHFCASDLKQCAGMCSIGQLGHKD